MGPRPFGRGRHVQVVEQAGAGCGLQWGRDLSAAEGMRVAGVYEPVCRLQWGRDLSAAEGSRRARRAISSTCFNGAATFRPRKANRVRGPRPDPPASMGPRPFGRGRDEYVVLGVVGVVLQWGRDLSAAEGMQTDMLSKMDISLQWGRDLSAAEGGAERLVIRPALLLQWGRDLSAAEGVRPSLHGVPQRVLQWGRDLSAAEGWYLSYSIKSDESFNGAATFRPRKGRRSFSARKSSTSFNGAATFRPRKGAVHAGSLMPPAMLQWGRDLSAAEGSRRGPATRT